MTNDARMVRSPCGVRTAPPPGKGAGGYSERALYVAKGEIEDSLYQFGAEIESNAVEVYVSRLRKKLGRNFISTARGLGYQVAAER